MKLTTVWGGLSAALILLLSLGTLAAVASRAEGFSGFGPLEFAALRFTVGQAIVSAVLSILLAIPLARALARRQFWGRNFAITLLGAPFILPVIVAVLGLVAVFGRAGLISKGLAIFGLPPVGIYGAHGIVLAHVFFNLPLATRLILQGWQSIPSEQFRLAAQLGMPASAIQRHLEWPMLRGVVPGIFATIFLICTTSFAIALTLGGGPKATTLELAIYQAFRLDFDLGKAALLALVQFALCALAALLAWRAAKPVATSRGLGRVVQRWDLGRAWGDGAIIASALVFLLVPISAVLLRGLWALPELPALAIWAALRSVLVALGSACLAVALTIALAAWIVAAKRWLSGWIEAVGYLTIATSPLVLGTGLFILIFPFANPVDLALPITALVNAGMALPFALRAILPALRYAEAQHGRLAASLGMQGLARFRLVIWPAIRQPAGFSAGLAAALSMGDLGVITLFADPDATTLPMVMYRLMAAYKIDAASGAATLLVLLSFALFWAFEKAGRYGR